jgi:hypothetical protein
VAFPSYELLSRALIVPVGNADGPPFSESESDVSREENAVIEYGRRLLYPGPHLCRDIPIDSLACSRRKVLPSSVTTLKLPIKMRYIQLFLGIAALPVAALAQSMPALDQSDSVAAKHIAEAIQYRSPDRNCRN